MLEGVSRKVRRVGRPRGSGPGNMLLTTLLMALMVLVLAAAVGVVLLRYGDQLIPWIAGSGTETESGDVVVEDVQRLNELATVQSTLSVPVTAERD